jgi:hypothetical protein
MVELRLEKLEVVVVNVLKAIQVLFARSLEFVKMEQMDKLAKMEVLQLEQLVLVDVCVALVTKEPIVKLE